MAKTPTLKKSPPASKPPIIKPPVISKKFIWLAIALIVLVLVLFFGTKIYLLFNLLVGNDVLIRVNIDKQNLFLYHDKTESVNIKTDIVANPFCTVYCNYTFRDLSFNSVIESKSFSLKTIQPVTNELQLTSPALGEGQKLYRFEIECNSRKTYLCDTTEEMEYRTLLITLDYNLTSEEKESKDKSKDAILNASRDIGYVSLNLPNYQTTIYQLNSSPDMIYFNNKSEYIQRILTDANLTLTQTLDIWKSQNYPDLEPKIQELLAIVNKTKQGFKGFSIEFSFYSANYNSQINKTLNLNKALGSLIPLNLTTANAGNLSTLVKEYNLLVYSFDNMSFSGKEVSILNLENKLSQLQLAINSTNQDPVETIKENLTSFNKTQINTPPIDSNISTLEDPLPTCCLFEECRPCCDNACYFNKSQFPVIFIHGHNFNKDISADNNLHAFEKLQKTLEKDGYVNSGAIFVSKTDIPGILGKTNSPLTMTASYYFDTLIDTEGEATILEFKKDSIDTYAIRLNDLVKETKRRTNREKVVLVTHSMGGLVARRYLQIFGENDVEKLILIMVPNKGISGNVKTYCSLFGSDVECSNMDEDSLFINKLNNADPPKIPVYNIIGIGCIMEGEAGDGIVKNRSAYLDWTNNTYIEGTCDDLRFKYLHTDITDPSKYPQITNILKTMIQ